MNTAALLNADNVREAARGRWRSEIFPALGIDVGNGKHRPCPYCGGRDRFFCDDEDGRGTWFCRQCAPRAGDGFAMVQKIRRCAFPDAMQLVAGIIGLDGSISIDRAALARERISREQARFECERLREVEGLQLDACREAEATTAAASGIDISRWSDEQLDVALTVLADVYCTLEREGVTHE